MVAAARLVAMSCLLVLAGAGPAGAWWQYAEWGLSEGQIRTASSGQAVPCRADAPVCARTSIGEPRLFVELLQMVGMPASASFVFDAQGRLIQTIVLFPNADFALVCSLLQGIHGTAIEDRPGEPPVRVWRDGRRGSIITATSTRSGTTLSYQPVNRPG